MNRLLQDVLNYFLHFVVLYVACCILLGSLFSLVALVAGGILYFGFGAHWVAESNASLGGVGIGLSLAFLVSLVLAFVGTWLAAPSEQNMRRDYVGYGRGILSKLNRPATGPTTRS